MTILSGSDEENDGEFPNANLSEQDEGIIGVFARSDHKVLTTTEIADEVSIGGRQVRRRLDSLADEGILGVRKPNKNTKIAWLEKDVKEPITVKYPLLKYIIHRTSGIFFLIGLIGGVVAVQILLVAAITIGYSVDIGVPSEVILISGVTTAVFSALFFIVAGLNWFIEWGFSHYDISIEEKIREWRGT